MASCFHQGRSFGRRTNNSASASFVACLTRKPWLGQWWSQGGPPCRKGLFAYFSAAVGGGFRKNGPGVPAHTEPGPPCECSVHSDHRHLPATDIKNTLGSHTRAALPLSPPRMSVQSASTVEDLTTSLTRQNGNIGRLGLISPLWSLLVLPKKASFLN